MSVPTYNHAMCGRYTLHSSTAGITALFNARPPATPWEVRYNLAPTQQGLVVRLAFAGRTLTPMRWGLIPYWADDPSIGNRMINARAESVAIKPGFRRAFKGQRCLVPADGLYEWQAVDGGAKQPWLIRRRDSQPLAFAGLWDRWDRGGDRPVESYTIITGEPNALLRRLHERMPVVLPGDAWSAWLGERELSRQDLQGLLVPCPAEELEAVPVSRVVNSPANEGPECVEPSGEVMRVDGSS